MYDKYIVIIADMESGTWTEQVQTTDREVAQREFEELKEDGTPAILIYTGDFIHV